MNKHEGEAYLSLWGRYHRNGNRIDIGYPKKSPFVDDVGVIRSAPISEDMPDDVSMVDGFVHRMPSYIIDAVKMRFIVNKGDKYGAKEIGVSVKTYRERYDRGIWIVAALVMDERP